MRLLSPTIATALIALGLPAVAEVDDAVHEKCSEAIDYNWCIEVFSTIAETESENETVAEESNRIDEYAAPEYHSKARQKAPSGYTPPPSKRLYQGKRLYQAECPPGTGMVTVDERWNFLFMRGGKKRKIGCMTQSQLSNFNAQRYVQHDQQRRQTMMNLGSQHRQYMQEQSQPVRQTLPATCSGSAISVGGVTTASATCF